MNRRTFLTSAAALPLAFSSGRALGATPSPLKQRVLVLVELNGGNDGLNTVIPYADPLYRKLRPNLGIGRDRVLPLDEHLGLHPSLEPLRPLWSGRRLGIALGVGYPEPNLSHFRSIEVWNTGSNSAELLDDGWIARAFAEARIAGAFTADGVVLGDRSEPGPLFGPGLNVLGIDSPAAFAKRASQMANPRGHPANPALSHILEVQTHMKAAARTMVERRLDTVEPGADFPVDAFGRQMRSAAQLIVAGIEVPVIKVALGGFDTHRGQAGEQARLLGQLAAGLAAFARAMEASGQWDRVLVMTYAEFGRRPAENASGGTDHGTAAPHFLLGGRVRGGFYGAQPPLDDLAFGNLKYRVHYRSLVATALREWWGLKAGFVAEKALGCLA